MSTDLEVINLMKRRDNYDKYAKFIKEQSVSEAGWNILKAMGEYFKSNPLTDSIQFSAFEVWFDLIYTGVKSRDAKDEAKVVLKNLDSYTPTQTADDVLKQCMLMGYSASIVDVIMQADGKPDMSVIRDLVDEYQDKVGASTRASMEIEEDWANILNNAMRTDGAQWRLDDLNVSIGKVAGGDFIVIGARPETGKTSFALSEGTFFIEQMDIDKDLIVFNNEEGGERLLSRAMQTTIGKDIIAIANDTDKAVQEYEQKLGREKRVRVIHNTSLHIRDVDRVLRNSDVGVIIFNTLPKMRGFDKAGNEVQRQEEIFHWARDIADKHDCVVMAIAQADGSAEGQRWLSMNQLYGSKTAVQGEADVIILIGMEDQMSNDRFISIAKNKLAGDANTNPKLKHGKHEVEFIPETGRYVTKYTGGINP